MKKKELEKILEQLEWLYEGFVETKKQLFSCFECRVRIEETFKRVKEENDKIREEYDVIKQAANAKELIKTLSPEQYFKMWTQEKSIKDGLNFEPCSPEHKKIQDKLIELTDKYHELTAKIEELKQ